MTKINHASVVGGLQETINAVSKLTGLPIHYYAVIDYQGLEKMVNVVGGIEVNLPFKVTLTHPRDPKYSGKVFQPGTHYLDGKLAAEIVHERYSVTGTDFGRQQLQKIVLMGIAKKATSPSNVTRLPNLIKTASSFLTDTNMNLNDMISLGLALKDVDLNSIRYYQVPVLESAPTRYKDPLVGRELSYVIPDTNALEKLIQENFAN